MKFLENVKFTDFVGVSDREIFLLEFLIARDFDTEVIKSASADHITSNFLKAVFHKFYLVDS